MTIAIGAVALVVVGIVVLAALGNNPVADIVHPSEKPVPQFAFTVAKTTAIPIDPAVRPEKLKGVASSAAEEATVLLNTYYTQAFLDPSNWEDGSYDDAWDAFDEGSSAAAQQSADTMTAGATAGDTYDDIQPGRSILRAEVLFDAKGQPMTVSATVTFKATGTKKAGGSTIFLSEGTFFLQQVGGEWNVISFEVKRDDQDRAPKPTATESPSGAAS